MHTLRMGVSTSVYVTCVCTDLYVCVHAHTLAECRHVHHFMHVRPHLVQIYITKHVSEWKARVPMYVCVAGGEQCIRAYIVH